MEVITSDARTTQLGRADYFSGSVFLDEINAGAPSKVTIVSVTFEPGARTAWHTHPVSQILYVLSGAGFVQLEGEPVRKLRPGDTVVIGPDERHWHGAAPNRLLVHLAVQEPVDGSTATWLEHVSEEDYRTAVERAT